MLVKKPYPNKMWLYFQQYFKVNLQKVILHRLNGVNCLVEIRTTENLKDVLLILKVSHDIL